MLFWEWARVVTDYGILREKRSRPIQSKNQIKTHLSFPSPFPTLRPVFPVGSHTLYCCCFFFCGIYLCDLFTTNQLTHSLRERRLFFNHLKSYACTACKINLHILYIMPIVYDHPRQYAHVLSSTVNEFVRTKKCASFSCTPQLTWVDGLIVCVIVVREIAMCDIVRLHIQTYHTM